MSKKKKVCNLIICDASGSMTSKIDEVRGELRSLFTSIKKEKGVKQTTIVCDFSNDFNVLCNVNTKKGIDESIADKYLTRGMTALYDAIGKGFQLVEGKYDGVFVSILTDGLENASREFTLGDIQKLIKEKRKAGWGIIFSGTTEEAIDKAKEMGMSMGNMVKYADNKKGMKVSSITRGATRRAYMSKAMASASMDVIDNDNLVDDDSGD